MYFLYTLYFFMSVMVSGNGEEPRLVWSDEFNYEGLPDSTRWSYDVGDGCPQSCGWGNNELQYYTKADTSNVRVVRGNLIIEARKKNYKSKAYTSVRLRSTGNAVWQYGYIEVRAKLPYGRGTWPAIWMMPGTSRYGGWPASGEIDIMEHVGYDPGVVHGTLHTSAFNHVKGTQVGKQQKVESFNSDFHTYSINWTEDKIEFYIDRKQYHTFENNKSGYEAWPFDHPFYLILNLAVGGNWGGSAGVDDAIWPQRMEVDYVRVYEPLHTDDQKKLLLSGME